MRWRTVKVNEDMINRNLSFVSDQLISEIRKAVRKRYEKNGRFFGCTDAQLDSLVLAIYYHDVLKMSWKKISGEIFGYREDGRLQIIVVDEINHHAYGVRAAMEESEVIKYLAHR